MKFTKEIGLILVGVMLAVILIYGVNQEKRIKRLETTTAQIVNFINKSITPPKENTE